MGLGYRFRELTCSLNIPGFFPDNILPDRILTEANQHNWELEKKGFFDIAPWPDIPMKKEDLFKKMGLGFLLKNRDKTLHETRTTILDYFNGQSPKMKDDIMKYSFLEKIPTPFKQLWAHHRYFLFSK